MRVFRRLGDVAAPYERLHAWRECHELALAIYRATKHLPTEESDATRATLSDQQTRTRSLTWQVYRSVARSQSPPKGRPRIPRTRGCSESSRTARRRRGAERRA